MASAVDPPEASPLPSHLVEHEKDPKGNQRGYIKGTDFSIPYSSPWSRIHDKEVKNNLLRHVNCSYLSTAGSPPSLLALKQHAQSLCVLIQALNPTLRAGEIIIGDPSEADRPLDPNSALARSSQTGTSTITDKKTPKSRYKDPRAIKYNLNSAFDFLSDLSTPYTNDDPNHHKPLGGLLNEISRVHEGFGSDSHCPLMTVQPRGSDERVRMYANHHNLVMHTNACLERLDHEFSPVGGLLGLLPVESEDPEGEDLAKARSSIFGQWLLFTQHLVARMHELERSYGNALDALAGEAVVPYQLLSSLGPETRQRGREIVFPQDKYLLVNAGEEVFETIHALLDRQEEIHQAKAELYRRNGVLSDSASSGYVNTSDPSVNTAADGSVISAEDGMQYAQGLIPVTIPTRYYRLAGKGHGTICIIPAWEVHPSVEYTRQLEDQPTVVSSFQPSWPRRTSELEKEGNDKVEAAKMLAAENAKLKEQLVKTSAQLTAAEKTARTVMQVRDLLLLTLQDKPRPSEKEVKRRRERAQDEGKEPVAVQVTDLEERFARQVDEQRKRADLAEAKLRNETMTRRNLQKEYSRSVRIRDVLISRLIDAGVDVDVDVDGDGVVPDTPGVTDDRARRQTESDELWDMIQRNDVDTLGFDASKAWKGPIQGYKR